MGVYIVGLCWVNIWVYIWVYIGLYMDNGKENGCSYLGLGV